jgi:hypothetical protein
VLHALLHSAREVGSRKSDVRSAQGDFPMVPFEGTPFRARLMARGGVAPETRQDDGHARVRAPYELLAWHTDDAGVPLELRASMRLLVVADVLTGPEGKLLEVDGQPELLNNGVDRIGWMAYLVEIQDSR